MKKTIATLVLATVLVGTGGTMALADESGPDTPISTDATENGIVSEDGTPRSVDEGGTGTGAGSGSGGGLQHSPVSSPSSLCEGGRIVYTARDASTAFTVASGKDATVSGESDITLSISRSTTFSVGGSITSTTGVSVSAGVAAVKEDIGVTISANYSGTSSSSGSWKVPHNWKLGRLEIGSIKHTGSVQRYVENKACKLVASGDPLRYKAPERGWSFRHVHVS